MSSPFTVHRSPNTKKLEGFTLIETLIVIAIIGFVSVIGTYKFASFQKDSQLTAFAEEFASTIKTAKNKSINAEILPSQNIADLDPNNLPYWGVLVVGGTPGGSYSLVENCTKSDLTSCTSSMETVNLKDNYSFINSGTINFERLTGKMNGANVFILQTPGNSECAKVTVDSNGEVNITKNCS